MTKKLTYLLLFLAAISSYEGEGWTCQIDSMGAGEYKSCNNPSCKTYDRVIERLAEQLVNAAGEGNESRVAKLLESGALIDKVDKRGVSPLQSAISSGKPEVVLTVIRAGASVNQIAKSAFPGLSTPLITSVMRGNLGIARILLANGATLDLTIHRGQTALIRASHQGQTDFVKLFLSASADVNKADEYGTPLAHSLLMDEPDVDVVLIDAGADVEIAKLAISRDELLSKDRKEKALLVADLLASIVDLKKQAASLVIVAGSEKIVTGLNQIQHLTTQLRKTEVSHAGFDDVIQKLQEIQNIVQDFEIVTIADSQASSFREQTKTILPQLRRLLNLANSSWDLYFEKK